MGSTSSTQNIRESLQELSDSRKLKTFEDEFWASYWQTDTMSVKDLMMIISLEDMREIRVKNRSNFISLCLHCMNHIYRLSKVPSWSATDMTIINNSVKWLIRTFPIILEEVELVNYFWETKNDSCLQSYATCLLQNICEMLFRSNYCVADPESCLLLPDPLNTSVIWKPGLVIKDAYPSNSFIDENRKNCLGLLMLMLSQELYFSRHDSLIYHDKWSVWYQSKSNKFSILIFTSLINYVCAMATELENSWSLFKKYKSFTVLYFALHILMLSLCTSTEFQNSLEEKHAKSSTNVFIELVESFHKKDDIDLIISSFRYLITMSVTKELKSGGNRAPEFHQECLVLLWRFCISNQRFMTFLLISPHMPFIVLMILIYLHDIHLDRSEVGFFHTSLSLLLHLSGERQFSMVMNSIYDGRPYFDLPKNSSYNDYMIYVFAKIIARGHDGLHPLHETIASIVYNVSPYMTLASMAASLTMICMLETAIENLGLESFPQSSSHRVVSLLLDSFNNVLSYGFNNNPYLIFSMILSSKTFYKLDSMANNSSKLKNELSEESSEGPTYERDELTTLSTENIVKFLNVLVPQVEKLCQEIENFNEMCVVKFLKRSTIVGIINKPGQIMTRRFEVLENVVSWIHIYTWTVIYLRNTELPIYEGSKVKLFGQIEQSND